MRDQHPYSDNDPGAFTAVVAPQLTAERHSNLDGTFFQSFAQLPVQRGRGNLVRTPEVSEIFGAQQSLRSLRQQIAELQSRVDAAMAEGHETGLAEGRSEAAREFAGHLTRTEQEVARFFSNAEATIADLAVRVAETIIGQVGGPDADYLAISRALTANIDREPFIVHASADTIEVVRTALADLKARQPHARLPTAKSDNRLPDGRAVLVTRFGSVDLDVQSQLKAIRDNLADADRDLAPPTV
jgi:flagellar biosynthesis/type III secretory pathway protein FliH